MGGRVWPFEGVMLLMILRGKRRRLASPGTNREHRTPGIYD